MSRVRKGGPLAAGGVLILLAGGMPAEARQAASPQARHAARGFLELKMEGNRKICARLHEPELIRIMYPESYPRKQFTTYGYRLQFFAAHQELEALRYLLADSGKIPTVGRKKIPRKWTGRNPLPAPLARSTRQEYREFWMTDSSCYQVPDFDRIPVQTGVYELKIVYSVRGPNGSWFRLIEVNLPDVRVDRGQTTPVVARIQDDGRNRDLGFYPDDD